MSKIKKHAIMGQQINNFKQVCALNAQIMSKWEILIIELFYIVPCSQFISLKRKDLSYELWKKRYKTQEKIT